MMKKRKKIYLPKWQRQFILPLFMLIWGWITYQEFFSNIQEKLGLAGYLVTSLIFLGLGVMIWLMSSGKLPAYIIEEDEDNKG